MTRIALDRMQPTAFSEVPPTRYRAQESPLPPKPADEACCPHCHQSLADSQSTTLQRLRSGVGQLFTAIVVILFSVLRLARLVVAVALSFVGLAGFGIQNLANRLVHPNDRNLLPTNQIRSE